MTTTTAPTPSTPTPTHSRVGTTALTALAPAVWGTTYLVTTEFLPAGHPLFAALMRALPAGLIGLLIARRLPAGSWWWKAVVLGTLNIGIFFPLLFVAAARLPGGVAATLGAASMGTGVILVKRWGLPPGIGPVGFASWQLSAGGLVLLLPTLLIEGVPAHVDAPGITGYLWLGGIGGLLAYALWFRGLGRLPVTATALLGLLSPLVAAGLGIVFAGESLNVAQVAGFVLALAALACGQLTPTIITRTTNPAEKETAA
ncbi:EamA family transporter [Brevibacterium sp. K11IcPPYGO002]|uniref:EamA family transporter n=1 Tax=Brevibacterium sp. K11IcPPYGO002 TaxID=3058837 RepID=UPI003D814B46